MLSKYSYWLYESVLDKKICNQIIAHFKGLKTFKGKVGKSNELDKGLRDSDVLFSNEKEIYDIILPFVFDANKKADWNADINWHESMQFTIYKKNQHYDWHADNLERAYDEDHHPNYRGKIRKLSLGVSLTDPKKYEGGEFYFKFGIEKMPTKISAFKKQGSVIVFPSFVYHKVTPVTKGTRYSLINWSLGAPWR